MKSRWKAAGTQMKVGVIGLTLVAACGDSPATPTPDPPADRYFPPISGSGWETLSPAALGWNENRLDPLYRYLEENGTRAFIILHNGRIVVEEYWGSRIQGDGPFTPESAWYWASAGKTITALLVGIAQERGLMDIDRPSSDYLGPGWSSLTAEQEARVTVRHHLTMTTGLDYEVPDPDCTDAACLQYRADPGTQWFYHNAPYTLVGTMVAAASGSTYNGFTNQVLEAATGMSGAWLSSGSNVTYWSVPRDMARFGLLVLNQGRWGDTAVLSDLAYLREMTTPSQTLNPSYGYLWWLNGQSSIIVPGLPNSFDRSLAPNAPDDLILAAGRDGQFVDVVPSLELVVIRMGEAADEGGAAIGFHDEMWARIGEVIPF